jgi:hypothetical protein
MSLLGHHLPALRTHINRPPAEQSRSIRVQALADDLSREVSLQGRELAARGFLVKTVEVPDDVVDRALFGHVLGLGTEMRLGGISLSDQPPRYKSAYTHMHVEAPGSIADQDTGIGWYFRQHPVPKEMIPLVFSIGRVLL